MNDSCLTMRPGQEPLNSLDGVIRFSPFPDDGGRHLVELELAVLELEAADVQSVECQCRRGDVGGRGLEEEGGGGSDSNG